MARQGAPRGKRELPHGIICIKRSVTLHPRQDRIIEERCHSLRGGRSEFIRRAIDHYTASLNPASPN